MITSDPFTELNLVAPWWTLRPQDKGNGKGYVGYYISVAGNGLEHPEHFTDDTLEGAITQSVEFCKRQWPNRVKSNVVEPGRIAPPRKRVVKRT